MNFTHSPIHVVLPEAVDDPDRPSGGNVYDRRVCDELVDAGWILQEHLVSGDWPHPTPADQADLARLLSRLPNQATVLIDGLIGSAAAALVAESDRLRQVLLVHMPLAEAVPGVRVSATERSALRSARAVVTTSQWARRWVLSHHGLEPDRVHVAEPGNDLRAPATSSASSGELLCVASVTAAKGHGTLVEALAQVQDLPWHCTCVGSLTLEPGFVDQLRTTAERRGIADRVSFLGPLSGAPLQTVWAGTDLVVSASRRESFGMALTEGLACGIPVLATSVGGHAEAVGRTPEGATPGLLVPVRDADSLAAALRRWLTDAALRETLRQVAQRRRSDLMPWAETAKKISEVLSAVRR